MHRLKVHWLLMPLALFILSACELTMTESLSDRDKAAIA